MAEYFKIILAFILFLFISFNAVIAEEILTWEDCLREAEKNHPDLISAVEGINVQKASKDITTSSLYPQVSTNVGASTGKTSDNTTDSYSYGVSGTQVIFNGFKNINDVKAASENIEAAKQAYRFTSSEVRLNLRSAFVNLLETQESIRVAEDIVNIRKDNLMLLTLQYLSGLEHKGALLTAEANVAGANFELSQAKRNLEFAQRQLTKEMGRKESKPIYVKGDFSVRDSTREKPNFEELVKNNPSLLQATAKKNSAAFSIKSAYGNFAPQISGSAGANKSSTHWPPENDRWDLGLSLTLPLFEGGLKTAQVSQAKALYNQTEANERSIRDAAVVILEQTWTALQDAIETVEVQRKTLEASEERSKIAEEQYSTGFIMFDNWIIIENELVKAKKAYLEAQANALIAEANWIHAKGETLEHAQ